MKSEEEIEKLIKASILADKCYNYICETIKVGMTEIEVAKLIDEFFLSNGASALAFDTIVGSGVNSSIIHSTPSDKIIEHGDIVQLDFGCVLDGYCSDCSRVLFMDEVKEEYKKIYDIVLEAQLVGINNTKVGMRSSQVDSICRDIIKSHGYDFKHAVGHGVGKEVHEDPVISPKNENDVIENDTVFTIEPGIYLENQFGIRIEDTCLMKNGVLIPLNKTSKEIRVIS